MSYLSLARKYRPKSFEDLVGQETTAQALANAISMSRIPASVIFSGIRGIGKTTTARLYAKALNCDKGTSPYPCGDCASCRAISGGIHEDVCEIDGASNNGVDEVRSLQETIMYAPQRSPYKVYIIDEVHMLSASAFNALLKTLEEPPDHVVFIFATTELHKIPDTVVGRCQTFHLKKLSLIDTIKRLRCILDQENIPYDEQALSVVASEGQGSMRDALTFLDQAIVLGGGKLSLSTLNKLLRSASSQSYLKLLDALVERDANSCMQLISLLDEQGIDFSKVAEELARMARNGFVLHGLETRQSSQAFLSLAQTEVDALQEIVKKAKPFDLNRIFRSFVQCRKDLDGSEQDRFVFENYCFEWCFDPGLPTVDELKRLFDHSLSKRLTNDSNRFGVDNSKLYREGNKGTEITSDESVTPKNKPKVSLTQAFKNSISSSGIEASLADKLNGAWERLINRLKDKKPLAARLLEEAYPVKISSAEVVVAVKTDSLAARLLEVSEQAIMKAVLAEHIGYKGDFRAVSYDLSTNSANALNQESLYEAKTRIHTEQQHKFTQEALDQPMTKAILQSFAGKVQSIELN